MTICSAEFIFTGKDQKAASYCLRTSYNFNAHAVTKHSNQHCEILIWGDPAAARFDKELIAKCVRNQYESYWGRSWIYIDHRSNCLVACTDKLGLFPIVFHKNAKKLLLTSHRVEMHRLLGEERPLNSAALIDLLAFGQIMDESTLMADVTQLRGSRLLICNAQGILELITKANYRIQQKGKFNFTESLEVFSASVQRCFRSCNDQSDTSAAISLSGGLDSRLILAAALEHKQRPVTFSYGHADNEDRRIAKEIAALHGLPFFTGSSGQLQPWSAVKRIGELGCGEVPIQHGHALVDDSLLELTRGLTVLTGTGAETFRAFYFDRGMPGYSILGFSSLKTQLLPFAQRYIREEFGRLMDPVISAFPALQEYLEERFRQMVNRYEDCETDGARYMDNVYLGERVARMVISGQQLMDRNYDRCHPFLDPEVLEVFANMPTGLRLGSLYHRKAIIEFSPTLGHVRWDKTCRPLNQGLKWYERYPGLASRLGNQHYWGKASNRDQIKQKKTFTGLYDYQAWLPDDQHLALQQALAGFQLSESEINAGINYLLKSPSSLHMRGLSHAIRGLNQTA